MAAPLGTHLSVAEALLDDSDTPDGDELDGFQTEELELLPEDYVWVNTVDGPRRVFLT